MKLKKETPAQVFFCFPKKFAKFSEEEHLRATASVLKQTWKLQVCVSIYDPVVYCRIQYQESLE